MKSGACLRRELAACYAMVRLAWQARANQGSNWLTWCILALVLVVPAISFAASKKLALSVGAGVGVPLTLLAMLWWMLLVASLVSQHRHTGRLVPAAGRRGVAVMLGGALAITLVLTALFALAGGAPLLGGVIVALALSIVAAWVAVPALGYGLYALLMAAIFLGDRLKALLPFSIENAIVTAGPVLIVVLGYAALRAIHRGSPERLDLVGLQERARLLNVLFRRAGGNGISGATSSFARTLRRDCANGRIAPLLMQGVGPMGRAPSLTALGVMTAVVLAIVFVTPGWAASHRGILRAVIPAMMAALQVLIVSLMVDAVYKTWREQALVRLAPRAPGAHALNAILGRALLIEYGRCWLGSSAMALATLYFLDVPGAVLLRILAVFLVTLTSANLLLRDYSSERAGYGSATARTVVMLGACAAVLAAPARMFHTGLWLVLGAALLAAGMALARLRWNRMLRAPAAFPAGRAG